METVINVLFIINVVIVVGGIILGSVFQFLQKEKNDKIYEYEYNEGILNSIKTIADTVVKSINQRWVFDAKQKNKDGKLTNEQSNRAFDEACETIIKLLNSEQIDCIKSVYNTVSDGLEYIIESAVSENHGTFLSSVINMEDTSPDFCFKGSVDYIDQLPTEGSTRGDIYVVRYPGMSSQDRPEDEELIEVNDKYVFDGYDFIELESLFDILTETFSEDNDEILTATVLNEDEISPEAEK